MDPILEVKGRHTLFGDYTGRMLALDVDRTSVAHVIERRFLHLSTRTGMLTLKQSLMNSRTI